MAIEEGDKIPAVDLDGTEGEVIALADKAGKPFVLYFYPKDDTSGCTREAQDFSALLPEFAALGAEVLGVTLSEEQLKVARQRARDAGVADKVKFELIDYRHVIGQFDRIVSVGMFEHVGTPHYRTFFRKVRELLTPEGVMLLHTIGRAGGPGVTDAFTLKYIFPGGYIPALSEIAQGYEGLRYFMTDVEVLRLHYAETLKHWYERTVAARDAIVGLYDERFYRMWCFYLAGCHVSFQYGGLVNYQLQFSRSRDALPLTRDYMVEAERALREPHKVTLRQAGQAG